MTKTNRMLIVGLSAVLMGLAEAAAAQDQPAAKPACAAMDTALPPALSGWLNRADLAAVSKASDAAKASLPIGKGVDAKLTKTSEVIFPVLPEKPGGSVSFSGLFEIKVKEAGNYQVSLGTGAWIDVISGKTAVTSNAHAPGPTCSTLKKTVVFPLTPGSYVLEIAGNGEAALPVMVSRVP